MDSFTCLREVICWWTPKLTGLSTFQFP